MTQRSGFADVCRAYLGTTLDMPKTGPNKALERRRIAVIGDLHGQAHRGLLQAVVALKPDMVVVAGDLIDARSFSTYPKLPGNTVQQTAQEDMANARAALEYLLIHTTANLLILYGNHDIRLYKKLSSILPDEMLAFVSDPLQLVIAGLPRCELVETVWTWHDLTGESDLGQSRYMLPIGDALVSHANFTGSQAGDAVCKLRTWVGKWRRTLELDPVLLLQAHTHSLCLLYEDGGNIALAETGMGCLPRTQDYAVQYDSKWKPGCIGGVVFEQHKAGGVYQTDLRSVRLIFPT